MKLHALPRAAVFSLCVFLSACGGGGDDPAPVVTELPSSVSVTSATTAEVDTAATFTTNITGPTSGLTFAWNFGDGSNSSASSPTHAYAAGGEYVVTLTVTNESGATRSTSTTLVANRTSIVKGSTCTGTNDSGWCWQRPKPAGTAMLDVFFVDASNGWAVGEVGQILGTSDGGATWVGQHSGVSSRLTQVRFVSTTTGWAVGDGATVVRTTDGGATWVAQASGLTYPYGNYIIDVLDSSRAVLRSPSAETRITVDGGEHWSASVLSPTVVTANGTMWLAQGNAVSTSADLGKTSTVSVMIGSSVQITTLDFADDSHGWVLGYDYSTSYPYAQVLWRTQDGGASWHKLSTTGLPSAANTMKFTSAGVGWAQLYTGLYRTTNGGTDWTAVTLPSALAGFGLSYPPTTIDDATLWLPFNNGGYLTRDGGASWTFLKVDAEFSYSMPRLQLTPAGTIWLHYSTRSYRSLDNGATWQQVFGSDVLDQDGNLIAAWFFDAKKGVAISSSGWLVETADSGQTWIRKAAAVAPMYGASRLQFDSTSTGWLLNASYTGDSISKTTDGGTSWWVPLAPVDFGGLSDFHFIDAQTGWAVGRTGAITRSIDGGQSWARQASLPYSLNGVRFASDQVGVAVGNYGVIARTDDAGASWTLRPSGLLQDLRRVTFVDANIGWAVGVYGSVVKTTDAGITWTKVAVPSTSTLNDVVFADARHGWIVGDQGVVLATADGGISWSLQASGTSKQIFGAVFIDSRTGWLVGAGGSILATGTGGN